MNIVLPEVWRESDRASLRGQRRTLAWAFLRSLGLIVAAASSCFLIAPWARNWLICATCFGVGLSLVSELVFLVLKPEEEWYRGRAIAESAKTLSWRYMARAEPFESDLNPSECNALYASRMRKIVEAVGAGPQSIGAVTLTASMAEVRALPLVKRKSVYVHHRLQDQCDWYRTKAVTCARSASRWAVILIVGQVVALILAVAQVTLVWTYQITELVPALVACAVAWVGIRQHQSLAAAYSTAANELILLVSSVAATEESDWGRVVADAEDAISREHTLWLASRARVPGEANFAHLQ